MAFFENYCFVCSVCHEKKEVRINTHLPERPEMCNRCMREKEIKEKEEYLNLFKEKTLEEKFLFLATEIYDIKNSLKNNSNTKDKKIA